MNDQIDTFNGLPLTNLMKVTVEIDFKLDTSDIILIMVSGGIGYLAKTYISHAIHYEERYVEMQTKNLNNLLAAALEKRFSQIVVVVHPKVTISVPQNCDFEYLEQTESRNVLRFKFDDRD